MSSNDDTLDKVINEKYCNESNKYNMLFEQYKLYVQMSNDLVKRRDDCNKFYTVLVGAVLTISSFLLANNFPPYLLTIPLFINGLISYNWKKHLEGYREKNEVKLKVIKHIENYLPAKGFQVTEKTVPKSLSQFEEKVPKWMLYITVILLILLILSLINEILHII